ncbi:MAG: hypothetical protein HOO96_43105 [Polyangiaceae bacterium]|nr:hypothetical protein [Polyangiaceae bacterium]
MGSAVLAFFLVWALTTGADVLLRAFVRWRAGRRALARGASEEPAPRLARAAQERPETVRETHVPEAEPTPNAAAPLVRVPSRLPVRVGPTRLPILFAHGYFGFDALGVPRRPEYFRGIRAALEAAGHVVHVARVSPTASVAMRAAELEAQVRRLNGRVNIIAHSMGGLDARYAITELGLADAVASLVTVGTPHFGTPLADSGASVLGDLQTTRRLLATMGLNLDGLYDLTTPHMAAFNRKVVDHPGVLYASVVGSVNHRLLPVNALLAPGYAFLWRRAGANDGVVPAASQRWGEVLDEIDADHWAQIGWSTGFDARTLYATVAQTLAARGL